MSDIIKFDTEDSLTQGTVTPQETKIFNLVSEEHPILREVMPEFNFDNPPVNPNEFASALVETCKHYHGYGLSASQCGFKHRVFVMGHDDNYVAFFNPKLLSTTGESHIIEGCLSFPLLGLHITRAQLITVEYHDFTGTKREATFSGISARCFQHELDHMNGIVYTQRVKPMALQMGVKKRNKMLKNLRIK